MKVMCIASKANWRAEIPKLIVKKFLWGLFSKTEKDHSAGGPAYGEICTVTSSYEDKDKTYYRLAEYPTVNGEQAGFDSSAFIPISEIDEVELAEEREQHQNA